MRKMKLMSLLCAASMLAAARAASAALLYDNTGVSGLFTPDSGASIYFDDATSASLPAPYSINQVNFGYENQAATTSNFDLLVQFYDKVNYNAGSGVPVGTIPIGDLVDIKGLALAGNSIDETGLISLIGNLPISTTGSFGFEYEFVKPGKTTFTEANLDPDIVPIFRNTPEVLGSSNPHYAYDFLNQNTIVGDSSTGDIFTFAPPAANVYAAFGGTAVPEPGSLSLLAVGAISLLSRSKRTNNRVSVVT